MLEKKVNTQIGNFELYKGSVEKTHSCSTGGENETLTHLKVFDNTIQ